MPPNPRSPSPIVRAPNPHTRRTSHGLGPVQNFIVHRPFRFPPRKPALKHRAPDVNAPRSNQTTDHTPVLIHRNRRPRDHFSPHELNELGFAFEEPRLPTFGRINTPKTHPAPPTVATRAHSVPIRHPAHATKPGLRQNARSPPNNSHLTPCAEFPTPTMAYKRLQLARSTKTLTVFSPRSAPEAPTASPAAVPKSTSAQTPKSPATRP